MDGRLRSKQLPLPSSLHPHFAGDGVFLAAPCSFSVTFDLNWAPSGKAFPPKRPKPNLN